MEANRENATNDQNAYKAKVSPEKIFPQPQSLERLKKKKVNYLSTSRQVCSVLIFLGLYSLAVKIIPTFTQIPPPWKVLMAVFTISPTDLFLEIVRTSRRVLLGFSLSMLIGFPMGVTIGLSRTFGSLLFPAVEILRPIPPIAWIPLAVLFFVNIESQIIFLITYVAFFPVVYNTLGGITGVDIRFPRAALSLGVKKTQMLFRVILPAASPQIFAGMKISVGISWLCVVAAEMITSNPTKGGLGQMIWYNYLSMNYPMVFVGMGTIGVLGALSSVMVNWLGKRFTRWLEIF